MERHRQTVGYYEQTPLTAPQRDAMIASLHKRGWSYRRIGPTARCSPVMDVSP